jgi:hypothetical protein
MARSRKKTPIAGVTSARSEKADKAAAHRRERRKVRAALAAEPEPEVLPDRREVGNVWASAKDGKAYAPSWRGSKLLRK